MPHEGSDQRVSFGLGLGAMLGRARRDARPGSARCSAGLGASLGVLVFANYEDSQARQDESPRPQSLP
jgi:hypothetical protein